MITKLKFLILNCIFAVLIFSFALACYAKEITIIYTGETHAMLYPCSCPIEPDGGIARRATLIKEIRAKDPNAILLDSGSFFAGGPMDEYTQNTQADMERTRVNLKAMELTKYDALAIGDDEFNFGRKFFQENICKTNLNFLSCNISDPNAQAKSGLIKPYLIKEVLGAKIGIIGVNTPLAAQKAEGFNFTEPKLAVANAIKELRKNNVNIIVLLSHLGENEDLDLINDVQGVDILIVGHNRSRPESFAKVANTLVLRPSWQARRLGKVTLTIADNKIADYKVEELRLSSQVADDPAIISILPQCFQDANCKKKGFIGACKNPGNTNSRCLFTAANKVSLLIITAKGCVTCKPEATVNFLKKEFAGLQVSYLYYPDKKARKLVKDLVISSLPAYLLGKEAEKEKKFDSLQGKIEKKGDFYMLNPRFSGFSYFIGRKRIKGKFDLFISLYGPDTTKLLDVVKELNPDIHFLAIEKEGRFDAARGNIETEEYLRAVCIQKYYPKEFWQYLVCRANKTDTSWWDDCAANLDIDKIKSCANAPEGVLLLKENISLNKEFQVMFGPTYLLENQEIFSSSGVPTKEELEKTIRK
jgi:hypothetical protein